MKIILVFCLLIYANICRGQVVNYKLFCGDYTYIQFRWESQNDYPILFDAIVKHDTIEVDMTDLDTFSKSLFSKALYVPTSESAYQRGLDILFGSNEETFDYGLSLVNMLGGQVENVQRQGVLSLLNGDYILYKYAEIRAGFVELDKNCDWRYTRTSIGIEDSSLVNRIVVPISIISIDKKVKDLYIRQLGGSN